MSLFATLSETRQLGAPVVGLFRTGLGRDPDVFELRRIVPMVRERVQLPAIAREIVDTPEFKYRYGAATPAELVDGFCRNAFGPMSEATGPARLAAALCRTEADVLAAVTGAALATDKIPLLPGLVPGAAPDDPVAYALWVSEYDSARAADFGPEPPRPGPSVTVSMAMGDTEAEALRATVESLRLQQHKNWELCLTAHTLSPWSREVVERLAADDERVRLIPGRGWSAGVRAGNGPLFCVLAPGDRLPPGALAEVAAAFALHGQALLVYTDEDVEDQAGRRLPRFKPAFSRDALLDGDAIGQLAVYRDELIERIGALPDGSNPARDLPRRAGELLEPHQVIHLPRVLCHRGRPPSPINASPVFAEPRLPAEPPLITAIVPTRDRADLLGACISGLMERTAYPRIQAVIVDNGSSDERALALLADFATRPGIRVLREAGPFNFAALNNAAAATAEPGILLLLNNDVEVLEPGWLSEMVAQVTRPNVGIVGARLLYPDRTIQHAGILLGPDSAATHVGRGAAENDPGYLGQLACVRDLSAVTGACLAISTETWRRVGGMDERLAVTWNDVDLCLRVRQAGLRVLWTPRATLLHHESASRGLETEGSEKLARFRAEQALVASIWSDVLDHDPFLNPNLLALQSGQLVLTRPRHRAPTTALPFASTR